ncbi:hypothetical protein WN51_01419 [Melipona quadrifasciata]|uniref:Uncharacterized protein n=1 Tax=Melipona quadrifasciata TaxID=166423 RepID=A0A0N1ITE1_9HYME|nr:hypothetical protein WN51_01419 [Melipona quadrifasciata]
MLSARMHHPLAISYVDNGLFVCTRRVTFFSCLLRAILTKTFLCLFAALKKNSRSRGKMHGRSIYEAERALPVAQEMNISIVLERGCFCNSLYKRACCAV